MVNKPSSLPIHPCGSYRSCLSFCKDALVSVKVTISTLSFCMSLASLGMILKLQRLQFIDCDSAQSRDGRGSDDSSATAMCKKLRWVIARQLPLCTQLIVFGLV